MKNLDDADKVLREFTESCVQAGPQMCGLYESTPDKVDARLHKLLDNLKKSPIPILDVETPFRRYGMIDYKLAKQTLLLFTYSPYSKTTIGAKGLSWAFYELEKRNGAPLWTFLTLLAERFTCDCPVPGQPSPPNIQTPDALQTIACTDARQLNDTVEDLQVFFSKNAQQSELADVWPIRALCA